MLYDGLRLDMCTNQTSAIRAGQNHDSCHKFDQLNPIKPANNCIVAGVCGSTKDVGVVVILVPLKIMSVVTNVTFLVM